MLCPGVIAATPVHDRILFVPFRNSYKATLEKFQWCFNLSLPTRPLPIGLKLLEGFPLLPLIPPHRVAGCSCHSYPAWTSTSHRTRRGLQARRTCHQRMRRRRKKEFPHSSTTEKTPSTSLLRFGTKCELSPSWQRPQSKEAQSQARAVTLKGTLRMLMADICYSISGPQKISDLAPTIQGPREKGKGV